MGPLSSGTCFAWLFAPARPVRWPLPQKVVCRALCLGSTSEPDSFIVLFAAACCHMQVPHCNFSGCPIHCLWSGLGMFLLQTMCLPIVTCMCFVLPHAGCPLQRCGLLYTSPLVPTRDIFIANNVFAHCNLHVLCTATCRLPIATLRVALYITVGFDSGYFYCKQCVCSLQLACALHCHMQVVHCNVAGCPTSPFDSACVYCKQCVCSL